MAFWGLEMRDKSSDCTLSSGGAVANGFALEIFGEGAGFEAFGSSTTLASALQAHQTQCQPQAHLLQPLEPGYR